MYLPWYLKSRLNDRNIWTQQIPTSLAQHLQLRPNDRNVWTQHITTSAHARAQHFCKCWMKNLTIFKFESTTFNMSQCVATGWLNGRNMLRPTMLRYAALKCFDRLAGAKISLSLLFDYFSQWETFYALSPRASMGVQILLVVSYHTQRNQK